MSVALENARLFDETRRLLGETEQRAAELAIINSVQAALAAEINIQGIYDTVGDKIREIFHNTDMGIRIYDPKTNLEHFPYIYENGERITFAPDPLPEKGFSAHVIRSRETLVINENMLQEVEKYGSYTIPGTQIEKSAVFVPLVVGDQVRGLINLTNMEREQAFSEADVHLLQTLANSMSVALENARLFDETQRLLVETQKRTAELEIINRVGMALARQLDYDAIVALVGERLREIFPGQMCSIALYNKATDTISWPYFAGFDGQQISQQPVTLGEGLTSHVIQSRQPLVLGSLKEAEPYGAVWVFEQAEQEPKSWIGVPILVSDEATGVLAVQDMPEDRYSENDVRLLATLAASMGVALENARLFAETKILLAETEKRASEMAALAEIGSDIASTHEIAPVLERLVVRTKELLNVSEIVLFMVDPSGELPKS